MSGKWVRVGTIHPGEYARADSGDDSDAMDLARAVAEWRERTGKAFPPYTVLVEIIESLGWHRIAK